MRLRETRQALDTQWGQRVLRMLVRGRLSRGSLTIRTPSGERIAHVAPLVGPHGEIALHRWRAVPRLLLRGDIGFADAFIDGDWSSPDLVSLIELIACNGETISPAIDGTIAARLRERLRHALCANTKRQAKRNITAHYDLGNQFYAAWLDAGMSYSSALYDEAAPTLEAAQARKQDRILELLSLQGGERVLELGCGWGGLAERLSRAGAPVTAVTISPAQHEFAARRLAGTGTELRLQDYRDVSGAFDRVVAIEMMEAVGAAYWPAFMASLRDRLRPGGIAVLQVISIAETRFAQYSRQPDFIQRHIFPGGMLPTVEIMRSELARAGLVLEGLHRFGDSYARTLAEWRLRFCAAWEGLAARGFDERFRRRWLYYLCYCEAGFRAGTIDVGLYRIVRPVEQPA